MVRVRRGNDALSSTAVGGVEREGVLGCFMSILAKCLPAVC